MDAKIRFEYSGTIGQSGKRAGTGSRKAPGQSRRTHDDPRPAKKNTVSQSTAQRRSAASSHIRELGSVSKSCKRVGLATSTYYYQPKKDSVEKAKEDADIRDRIEAVQAKFSFYGYRRIHHHLERLEGLTVNEKRIIRIMRENGLKAIIWRGFKMKTTNSNHSYGYAPNLLPGRIINGVNQVWITDLTYIRIQTGFIFLSVILDLYSRKAVGWAISTSIDADLCLAALDDAVRKRQPPRGLIHHSDRGVQYACDKYRVRLVQYGIIPSMSAKGYCYDNAFMESWFKTLKAEEVYLTEYETIEDVLKGVPNFIEAVYNKKRLHSSLNYFSPDEFEDLVAKGLLEKHGIQPVMQLSGKPSN